MNLFPGRVVGEAPGGALLVVEAAGLGRIELPRTDGLAGEIGVAVRPEKVRLSHDEPPAGTVRLRGEVAQIAYFGDVSHVHLLTPEGLRVTCNRQNRSRAGEAARLRVGQTCWAAFDPADGLLLGE